ncbi:MAG: flagellar biosynthesis protein FlgD [Xanthobacteraceae bacterium]|nr:flagellar biosynthesis protein FlgD [Xanthobacteraceae bacterium]
MAVDATLPTTIVSAPAQTTSSSNTSTSSTTSGIADNFQTFLTLLTTQLQNQNPLDPLDTNQFTQQLVQFAGVEQQLKTNDQLSSLVTLQKTAQSTQALNFVGATAVVDGSTATLADGSATWALGASKPSTVTVTISNATGQAVYTGSFPINAGDHQTFEWDGRGNDGVQWPDGSYTLTATAKDASGQAVAISTEIQGVVQAADLTQDPPTLSIGDQSFTIDKVKKVVGRSS